MSSTLNRTGSRKKSVLQSTERRNLPCIFGMAMSLCHRSSEPRSEACHAEFHSRVMSTAGFLQDIKRIVIDQQAKGNSTSHRDPL